jgi:RNA polymerase sigma-70 factor (ECF subfamily)
MCPIASDRCAAPAVTERRASAIDDLEVDLLAHQAQRGERAAAAELCSICAPWVQRYFRRVLGNRQEAEEATQHVMAQLLGALPAYREEGTPFRAFVFRLAHNHGQDRHAARARTRCTDPSELARLRETPDTTAAGAASADQRDSLSSLIAPLPPMQQQVIMLIYQHDLTPAQAGRVLGCTAASVRQLHKRARDALREIVLMQSQGA